jgi:hypothetical protein
MFGSKRTMVAIGVLVTGFIFTNSAVAAPPASAPVSDCQLSDARVTKFQPNNLGFPHKSDIIPNLGKHKVILIPIDFSDAPGTKDFLAQQNELMKTYSSWYKFFSNGRASAEVVTANKWFRAPKPSSSYVVGQNQPNTANKSGSVMDQIAQDFINATGKTFDFKDSPGVFFIYPKMNNIGIETSLNGRGVDIVTPQGTKQLFYFGPGKSSYKVESRQRKPYSKFYGLWIHEILHSQGMALHAPGNGFPTGLGQDQEGASLTIGMWEQFLLGWLKDSQVYCAPASSLTTSTIVLNPLEVASSKLKTAIVPLSKTQALVVESRRPVGYSSGWDKVDGGVFVYLVDTTKDNDRSGESNSSDRGNDMAFSKWAFYLAPDGSRMKNSGNFYYQYRDYFVKKGQSVTYGGVKITVLKSGSTDTIKLEKVAG